MIRFALAFLVVAAAPVGAQAWNGGGANIPDGHRPPPGMCRIWLDGVPPGRQPAPTDCATAIRRRPPNARVIFGEEVRATRDQRARDQRDQQSDQQPRDQQPRDQQPRDQQPRDQQSDQQPRDQQPQHVDRQPEQPPSPPPARDARPADKGKGRKPDHPLLVPSERRGHPPGWLH